MFSHRAVRGPGGCSLRPGRHSLLPALLLILVLPGLCGAAEWPFLPPVRPAVPQVKHGDWGRNPIDAFVLARLEQGGLRPNPPADRVTLLRRVTFDLTGLLPTPAERDAFLADTAPGAYERLVDRLLASPHFGERWAQHWLDVVRFAETEGFKTDRLRPEAYRYRDYVIRAFNGDLPYDRFVRQQLAGDELEPGNPDALVATGLLRLHPEETTASNYTQMRQDILNDVTDVFGAAFLGLTVGCARCHDHKFDPIAQKDYYSLQSFFAGMLHRDDLCLAPPEAQARYRRQQAAWETATRDVRAEIDAVLEPARRRAYEETIVIFDPDTQTALRTPDDQRTGLQRQLAVLASKQLDRRVRAAARLLPPEQRARLDGLKKRLAGFDSLKPEPLPVAMAVTDAAPVAPVTHRLAAGSYLKPCEEVQPVFLPCLLADAEHGTRGAEPRTGPVPGVGRRAALARWLSRPDHPMTARVIVNRLWLHYLGQGIVGTPNDFGAMGEPPTHPVLLDYLATELVRNGWRLKAIHRLIVTSAAYRQSSDPERNPVAGLALKVDPADKLLWHAHGKRREAEAIRDAVLQLSGQLHRRMFGPSARPELPEALADNRYSWDPDERPEDQNRRSVYVFVRRNLAYPLFAAFDTPERNTSCPVRAVTTTAPQALVLLNSKFALAQARQMAARLLAAHPACRPFVLDDVRALVRSAYQEAFNRDPEPDELAEADKFLGHQARLSAPAGENAAAKRPGPAFTAAVADFCHALINAAELIYVE
jgi:hypothetical protein